MENVSTPQDLHSNLSSCFEQDTLGVRILRVFAYGVIFFISAVGNALIIATVWYSKKMRKPLNYFIVNMAAADLTVTLVYMPRALAMWLTGSKWLVSGILGTILCKVVPFLHGASILAAILTLLTISIDRFMAVVFPLKQNPFSLKTSRITIAFTWILAVAVRLPYLYSLRLLKRKHKFGCVADIEATFKNTEARDIYYTFLLVVFYALPFIIILVSYVIIIVVLRRYNTPCNKAIAKLVQESRGKASRKVFYMMLAVTAAFVCCWLTYFIAQILFRRVPCSLRFWRLFLAHSNSALNPCLYAIFNENFREGYKRLLCCRRYNLAAKKTSFHNRITKYYAPQRQRTLERPEKYEKPFDVATYETQM